MTTLDAPPSSSPRSVDPHTNGAAARGQDTHLQHHFDSPVQQFEAAKFGMWMFLATEVLLFGGLFCLYAVLRRMRPEIFGYGSTFLDVRWGALNTAVLIASSVTMAIGVTAAQRGNRGLLIISLALTLVGAGTFMGVKYVEYSHKIHDGLVWGVAFYEPPHAEADQAETHAAVPEEDARGDLARGTELWMGTCRSCHGVKGEGIPGQGKDQRGSEFIAGLDDKELVAFIKVGRMSFDPLNTTGIQMPPKGGNPMLTDADLLDIVTYVRTFEDKPVEETGQDDATAAAETDDEPEFWIPKSSIPDAVAGPPGVSTSFVLGTSESPDAAADAERPHHALDPDRPVNAHLFFGIYFLMTGLHGIHVLFGIGLLSWLLVRAVLGHFGPAYYTPVDLGGLYWHIVDLIWIFLFPLFYLI